MTRLNSHQLRLTSISTRLEEIDATRVRLLHQLAELETESRALHRERGLIMNENAAIAVLPNEILAAIFQAGHDSQTPGGHFEILASSVTRHWREVALRTPRLWTTISNSCARVEQHLSLYFSRSMAVPIELRIRIDDRDMCFQENIGSLRQLLSSHCARCSRLQLVIDLEDPGPDCAAELTEILDCLHDVSAPLLRRIDISFPEESALYEGDELREPAQIFTGGAPLLNVISLDNIALECCLPLLASVTAIYLLGPSTNAKTFTSNEWLEMMSSATSLIHLEIDGDLIVQGWVPSVAFEMPALQTLSIGADSGESALHGLLRCINAPHLKVLALRYFDLDQTHGICPNRFPSLHTLMLEMYLSPDSGLARKTGLETVLAAFPNIQHLMCTSSTTWGPDIELATYAELLSILTPRYDPSDIFMPRLRTIALPSNSTEGNIPWLAVRDMLVARKSIGRPIHKLFVGGGKLAEASALFAPTDSEAIVRVEEWKQELVQDWPALSG